MPDISNIAFGPVLANLRAYLQTRNPYSRKAQARSAKEAETTGKTTTTRQRRTLLQGHGEESTNGDAARSRCYDTSRRADVQHALTANRRRRQTATRSEWESLRASRRQSLRRGSILEVSAPCPDAPSVCAEESQST